MRRPSPMPAPSPFPAVPGASLAAAWHAYRATGDRRLRDRIVFTLAPLVPHAGAAADEAIARGLEALMGAIDDFEPERDGDLERYAWSRVRASVSRGG